MLYVPGVCYNLGLQEGIRAGRDKTSILEQKVRKQLADVRSFLEEDCRGCADHA